MLSSCTLVRSSNSTFLRFWHSEECRETFLSFLDQTDLSVLRLVSLDLSNRLAARCFQQITCTFRVNTFAKQSRIQALRRIGRHVETFKLVLPYNFDHVLPPLIDTETGEEKNFTYTPVRPGSSSSNYSKHKEPKYGDWETTDLLIRQYPPMFHAAANSASFAQAATALSSMSRLIIQGSGDDFHVRSHHRNVSDFALVSLRAALEQAPIHALTRISLQDLPTSAMKYLKPSVPTGSAVYDWCSQISEISSNMRSMDDKPDDRSDQLALVQDYLRNFRNLERFSFAWEGKQGPFPLSHASRREVRPTKSFRGARRPSHPALRQQAPPTASVGIEKSAIQFPHLVTLSLRNMTASVDDVQGLLRNNASLRDLDFEDVELRAGGWEEALRPLSQPRQQISETGDVPIMLAKDEDPPQQKPSLGRQDSGVSFTPSQVQSPNRTPTWREQEEKTPRKVCFVEELHKCEMDTGVNVRSSQQKTHKKKRDVFGGACGELKRIFRGGLLRWP
ncbi:hypothetical protein C1H76_8754 [Elsinoe australis]|uniref:Uncharacterized protein n=1 Tax=Elsinoe australis TaxID=40998 RepID=A0A4U7AM11_9PEZI|nr:hypothetical protein C1H76_8754 [Elsinoe australis]